MQPPSLLSLTIDASLLRIAHINDLTAIPEPILLELFRRTLHAGKLTEKILKRFISTGNENLLIFIRALKIDHVILPVLPTKQQKNQIKEMFPEISPSEVDVVIAALQPDLTPFMEEWRHIISPFQILIIKNPNLDKNLQIPPGFNHQIYSIPDIQHLNFSGSSAVHFGYLISKKKFVISLDTDCRPLRNSDAISQHLKNLQTPATPFFFNTLYDPYRDGADFVRGYPFSLRTGVLSAISCGICTDPETPSRFVDAVLTIPAKTMMPVPKVNVACNRDALGPGFLPQFNLLLPEIWSGMCSKIIAEHLGYGVKSGLPYVARSSGAVAEETAAAEIAAVEFFQSARLPRTSVVAEDCVKELAKLVRERLGRSDGVFSQVADAMEEWLELWKEVESSRGK